MPLALALAGGVILVGALAVFVVLLYRLAGLRASGLERRRWIVILVGIAVLVTLLSVVAASDLPPGPELYGLGLAVAGYLLMLQLQKRGHWLVTPSLEERAALPARREALAEARRRPAFWLLIAGFVLAIPILSVAVIIGFR